MWELVHRVKSQRICFLIIDQHVHLPKSPQKMISRQRWLAQIWHVSIVPASLNENAESVWDQLKEASFGRLVSPYKQTFWVAVASSNMAVFFFSVINVVLIQLVEELLQINVQTSSWGWTLISSLTAPSSFQALGGWRDDGGGQNRGSSVCKCLGVFLWAFIEHHLQ